jgi:predicted MPP superfamily phosphohydrolase
MLPSSSALRIGLIVLVAGGILSFFFYMFFHDELPYSVSKFLFMLGTTWMNFFIYLLLITLACSLIVFLNRFIPLFSQTALRHYTQENTLSLGLVLLFISMVLAGGYLKYLWKSQVVVPIQLEKTIRANSLHGDSIRVVAMSDLHLGYAIGASELEEWVRLVNNEQPDIVLIAGDIVDISLKPLMRDSLYKYLQKIDAPLGVYACLGNHEYYAGADKSAEFMKLANIRLLRDSVAFVDSTFYVVGRDDRTNPQRKSLSQLTAGLDHSKPIILIDHQPYDLGETPQSGVDLQISGHTHEGQIWPLSLITKAIYENPHGYIKKGKSHIYVSSGIGIWGGKFRIGTQSEFMVFNIKGKPDDRQVDQGIVPDQKSEPKR